MTSSTISISTQWALEGKQHDGEGYRILGCSSGDLNLANFVDALSRFQVGEVKILPQVSVSYARRDTQPGHNYVAVAIHWSAEEGQRHADRVERRDDHGRSVLNTSYFCLPYQHLADNAIGYLAMYEALKDVTLPPAGGPPIEVPIALPTSRNPAADDLAVRVAPLLLTGRTVCVLDAEGTGLVERLRFIDAVMELLPYGFRSRMTAATWMRATNRNHRFRLFFSSTPRAKELLDYEVTWGGDPGLVPIPSGDACDYLNWLQNTVAPLARLTNLTDERGFSEKDAMFALESVTAIKPRHQPKPRPAPPVPHFIPERNLPKPVPVQADACERALQACAVHLKAGDGAALRADIGFFEKFAKGHIDEGSRSRYRNLIAGLGLLQVSDLVNEKSEAALYEPLLRLAFTIPLSYDAYCRVQKCAGNALDDTPGKMLLAVLSRDGMTEPLVRAIVQWHLGMNDKRGFDKWRAAEQVSAIQLINLLSFESVSVQHVRMICNVIVEFLRENPDSYEPQALQAALYQHGFLAPALRVPGELNDDYQVDILHQFLKAAYPQAATSRQDLSRAAIVRILTGTGIPPTPALLSAVLMMVKKPETCQFACNAYVRASQNLAGLKDEIRKSLLGRLPQIDGPLAIASVHVSAPVQSGPEQ